MIGDTVQIASTVIAYRFKEVMSNHGDIHYKEFFFRSYPELSKESEFAFFLGNVHFKIEENYSEYTNSRFIETPHLSRLFFEVSTNEYNGEVRNKLEYWPLWEEGELDL